MRAMVSWGVPRAGSTALEPTCSPAFLGGEASVALDRLVGDVKRAAVWQRRGVAEQVGVDVRPLARRLVGIHLRLRDLRDLRDLLDHDVLPDVRGGWLSCWSPTAAWRGRT